MAQVAEAAGVNRESLYKAVSDKGNPSIAYLKRILEVLNIRFQLVWQGLDRGKLHVFSRQPQT